MMKKPARSLKLGALFTVLLSCLFLIALSNASAELVTAYTFELGTELQDVAVMLGGGGVASDDLSCSGTCTGVAGVFGQGVEVGLLDYLATSGTSPDLDPGSAGFTVSFWTYGKEFPPNGAHILTKYLPSNGLSITSGGYTTGYQPMTIEAVTIDEGSRRYLAVTGETVEGEWRHIVMTLDTTGTAKLYIDGTFRTEVPSASINPAIVGLFLGVASHDPTRADHAYAGMYDDIAIFDEALSVEDISILNEEGLEAFMGYTLPAVSGYLKVNGEPLDNARVILNQWRRKPQTTRTVEGYFEFEEIAEGRRFWLRVVGP